MVKREASLSHQLELPRSLVGHIPLGSIVGNHQSAHRLIKVIRTGRHLDSIGPPCTEDETEAQKNRTTVQFHIVGVGARTKFWVF